MRAELGLILRALDALDIRLDASTEQAPARGATRPAVDINAIVAEARKKKGMTSELVALLDGREIGRVRNDARGRLTLVYDKDWRQAEGAYPLSLSMPLAAEEHGPSAVQAFLWGLLPDNERVLERWARRFQVSARNFPCRRGLRGCRSVRHARSAGVVAKRCFGQRRVA
ncbi:MULTISPECIES: HipA N-terminal domain-containing protein [unclassified Bradyrhizobium]|uniref:HipA N-terminal domain-containing protein n=1 Tax=unclassified Bradyrhizobium TaxID=2631580 RepID=UPI0033935230